MKKILLLLGIFITIMTVHACQKQPIDLPIDEAFTLMNEAIDHYLQANSVVIDYRGEYRSTAHVLIDELSVKMKRMNESSMVAVIDVAMTVNDTIQSVQTHYQEGWTYHDSTDSSGTRSQTKEEKVYTDVKKLYTGFIKSTIDEEEIQNISYVGTTSEITLTFELASQAIEETLYVIPAMTHAKVATVSVTFTEKGILRSMDVEYEGLIDEVYGPFTYHADFYKINRYVIVPTLSRLKIDDYQEAADDDETSS